MKKLNFDQLVELNNHIEDVRYVLIEFYEYSKIDAEVFLAVNHETIKLAMLIELNPYDTTDKIQEREAKASQEMKQN